MLAVMQSVMLRGLGAKRFGGEAEDKVDFLTEVGFQPRSSFHPDNITLAEPCVHGFNFTSRIGLKSL